MTIEFVWPQTTGETLAWLAALYLCLSGVVGLALPTFWAQVFALRRKAMVDGARAIIRSKAGGLSLGIGLACLLLHPQPLLYLALGMALFFGAAGRFISLFADGERSGSALVVFVVESLLAAAALVYAFGIVA